MLRKFIFSFALLAVLAGCGSPTPAATITAVITNTRTPLPSATPTLTQTPSLSPTITPTFIPTPTFTPTPIPAAQIPIIEYHDPEFRLGRVIWRTLLSVLTNIGSLVERTLDVTAAANPESVQIYPAARRSGRCR